MQTCPETARDEIERLRAAGIEPTLDELAELMAWGEKIHRPPLQTDPTLELAPIAVGTTGIRLPRLTVQAELWLDHALKWFGDRTHVYAIAYAASIGPKPGAFNNLYRRADGVSAVDAWARSCPASHAMLSDAADILLGPAAPDAREDDGTRADLRDMLADLAVGTGQTVEYWLTRTGPQMARAIGAVYRHAAMAAGASYDKTDGEGIEALRGLMMTAQRIEERALAET